jgi:hypothetical protein
VLLHAIPALDWTTTQNIWAQFLCGKLGPKNGLNRETNIDRPIPVLFLDLPVYLPQYTDSGFIHWGLLNIGITKNFHLEEKIDRGVLPMTFFII